MQNTRQNGPNGGLSPFSAGRDSVLQIVIIQPQKTQKQKIQS
jgi:hypothetical protein